MRIRTAAALMMMTSLTVSVRADGPSTALFYQIVGPGENRVHAGETLWGIAERAYPGDDPREAVYRIRAANDIPGSVIVAGQKLVLP